MARSRKKASDDTAKGIGALLLVGFSALATFWKRLTPEHQILFVVVSIGAIFACTVLLIMLIRRKKQARRLAWERAIRALGEARNSPVTAEYFSTLGLSAKSLEKLAVQTYRQMGYKVVHTGQTGDHGVDAHLTSPNGQVEVVQCKQWNRPVGEREVRDLVGAMVNEKASHGIIWAPGGFSAPAIQWAKGKPITLADAHEISRIIETVYSSEH